MSTYAPPSKTQLESIILNNEVYVNTSKITSTIQGAIYRSLRQSTKQQVVIKTTSIKLHAESVGIINNKRYKVSENVVKEQAIQRYLTNDKNCPNSIAKYVDSFQSKLSYYVIMEDGGGCLFDFVVKVHQLIKIGKLDINEWHRIAKIIFKQMIEAIEYIHSKGIAHFDISLENFTINDLDVITVKNGDQKKMIFCDNDGDGNYGIQIKLIDFGLAERFKIKNNDVNWISNKYCGKTVYKSPEITMHKQFNAKSNDIFCLGVCFFMIIIGLSPWKTSKLSDPTFYHIWNGNLLSVLRLQNKLQLVNIEIVELFGLFFKNEQDRITMKQLKDCKWLN